MSIYDNIEGFLKEVELLNIPKVSKNTIYDLMCVHRGGYSEFIERMDIKGFPIDIKNAFIQIYKVNFFRSVYSIASERLEKRLHKMVISLPNVFQVDGISIRVQDSDSFDEEAVAKCYAKPLEDFVFREYCKKKAAKILENFTETSSIVEISEKIVEIMIDENN